LTLKVALGNENLFLLSVAYPGVFFGGGGSTNSVEDGGQS